MPKRSPVSTVARNVKVSRTVTFGFWTLECLSPSRNAVPGRRIEEIKGVSGITGCQRVHPVSTVARNEKVSRTDTFGFWTLECLSASRCAVPAVSLKESKRWFGHCIWFSAEFSACWLAMIHFYSGEISICDMASFSVLATRADVACNSGVGQRV